MNQSENLTRDCESDFMKLDQFDRLQELVEDVSIKIRQLRQKNALLEKENKEIKKKIQAIEQLPSGTETEIIKNLKKENDSLKEKNREIKTRLDKLVTQLELYSYSNSGVDS
ncbi:MAG: hypothetical protein AB7W47_02645 [Calditrichaceae bacterium]